MSIFRDGNQEPPFLVPFVVALAFGIPVAAIWYLVAIKFGLLAKVVTILLGCACGLGARIPVRGWHPAGAAIISTLILIVVTLSLITVSYMALDNNRTILSTAIDLATHGDFKGFADACLIVAGKTFATYPLGLYAAYRVSDAS